MHGTLLGMPFPGSLEESHFLPTLLPPPLHQAIHPIGQKWVQGSHSPWHPLPRGQMLVASPKTTESSLFYVTSQCFLKMALVSTFKKQILCFKIPGYGGVSVNSKSSLPYVKSWRELSRDGHRHRAMVTCCPPCSPPPSVLPHVQLAHSFIFNTWPLETLGFGCLCAPLSQVSLVCKKVHR